MAISLTVGLFLVRNSVGTWAHPIVWVVIVVAIALICWWLWYLFNY
jgi:hypothetical protein